MHKFKKGDKIIRVGYYHNDGDEFMHQGGVYTVESVAYTGMVKLVNSQQGIYYDDEKFERVEEPAVEKPVVEEPIFKNMKFRVNSSEHSKQIQEHLFTLGYKWICEVRQAVEKTDKPFLYVEECGQITYGDTEEYFKNSIHKEYTLQEITAYTLVEKKETITIDGKEYYKEDILKRLAELESLN